MGQINVPWLHQVVDQWCHTMAASMEVCIIQTTNKEKRQIYLPACNQNSVCGSKVKFCLHAGWCHDMSPQSTGLGSKRKTTNESNCLCTKLFQDNVTRFSLSCFVQLCQKAAPWRVGLSQWRKSDSGDSGRFTAAPFAILLHHLYHHHKEKLLSREWSPWPRGGVM